MPRLRKVLPWSALLLLTVLPVLFGLVQRRADGWFPESDDATIVLLAEDVLRGDPPLVGMISTGGAELSDPELHHPGPLELYLVAPFSGLLGPQAGAPLAAALISMVSIAGMVAGLHSIGGRTLAGLGFLTSALILWGIGGDAPTSVWNPHVVLLPFAAFAVHAAAAATGRRWSLVAVVAFGSLVAQTHLSYAGLVGLTVAWVAAVTAWRLVTRRDAADRSHLLAVGAGALLWLPPVIDQVRGEPGNLGQIWRSFTGSGGSAVGPPGLGELGRVLGAPILGLRPNDDLIRVLPDPTVADLLPLGLTVALASALVVLAASRHRRPAGRVVDDVVPVVTTVLVMIGAGCVTALRIPLSDGVQYQYYGLWMWPLAGVVWTLIGWAAWRLGPESARGRAGNIVARPWAAPVLGALVLACSALPRPGAWEPWAHHRRVAGAIAPSVADLDAGGPVLVRFRGATPYLSTGSAVVLSAAAAGHDVLVDPGAPTPVFPWREARRFTDQEVGLELWVVGGPGGADLPEGARTLATTATLDEAARREVRAEIEHARLLVADGVERGPRGASAADSLDQIDRVLGDPTAAFDSGELAGLAARGLVSVEGLSADDLFTLERLKGLAAEEAVALYLVTSEQRR